MNIALIFRVSLYDDAQLTGIAAGWIFYNIQPGTAFQLKYEDEVNNKKPNSYSSGLHRGATMQAADV